MNVEAQRPSDRFLSGAESFLDPEAALVRVQSLYASEVERLRARFKAFSEGVDPPSRIRAFYPAVSFTTHSFARVDTRLSYGFVSSPGHYVTTVTRPDLFGPYLLEQFSQLIRNHGRPIEVGLGTVPIPVHFAFPDGIHLEAALDPERLRNLREVFDVPDLELMDDSIVNGTHELKSGEPRPLALFTAPRVDYSLHRLRHYTGTSPEHFQNYVIFTNYQFYIDQFVLHAQEMMADPNSGYEAFVEPGNRVTTNVRAGGGIEGEAVQRLPQMPAYHLKRANSSGITMVNIGVGPSNAKTITDHVAVLRPHAWLMLGHCAGLRNTQKLGDYVLAHGYVREDHVLDADLPVWIPVPPLAEVQVALEQAVGEVTGLDGWELKSVMRTGTVATIDNRNWELRDHREPVQRFSQSRAIALDMESATIAANGFRFRVPYGTLLCVSDKPLHGEIKLPGMADAFYRSQVDQHLQIGILAMEKLRALGLERLHSRKLRSFTEVGFQ
ncbi:AMP nucleosidase [Segnochrobactrum spirostomi]|uniref:AMP nucleosidase n=1 Tax=Segnochrobactrum spirostomi TaxID=2608987 RepID=A0A6A7Y3E3_9HYPH|nr:AMP nucleosidase [Segnochrobactrum spirostomi]MQT12262.1 AMP nucleosidase [Segnochrobactrum spirostomi]